MKLVNTIHAKQFHPFDLQSIKALQHLDDERATQAMEPQFSFPQGKTAIKKNPGFTGFYQGSIAFAATSQRGETQH